MGTKYTFPKAIKADCHGCVNAAKGPCQAAGISVAEKSGSVTVKTRKGEKKYPNGWAWFEPSWKQYVMMVTDEVPHGSKKHVITIATDPNDITKGWKREALTHEMAHVFLERNHKEYGHQGPLGRKLNGKLFGWHKGVR